MTAKLRCPWAGKDALYTAYHDHEWGRAEYDGRKLFEKLCLEGQQAGLSWLTVLRKRAAYREAFYGFDPQKIAAMTTADIDRLLQNAALIRHRGKLEAIITNAKAYLAMQAAGEDFGALLWSFVGGRPQINDVAETAQVPSQTAASAAMAKALKKRGFVFVGATGCYALMQAMGMVDDHWNRCFCKNRM